MMPDTNEFKRFHAALTEGRPDYKPWYFLLSINEKDPIEGQGWKANKHQLSFESATRALKMRHNIGIAGTDEDGLVIIDVDDEDAFKDHKFIPTLTARSSSRKGKHFFYWTSDKNAKVNISLEHAGELRTNWYYVVAPGSYAKLSDSKDEKKNIIKTSEEKLNELPDEQKPLAGMYTLEETRPPADITYDDLPAIFKDEKTKRETNEKAKENKPKKEYIMRGDSNKSAIYDLEIDDVITSIPDWGRHPSLFHDSHTGKNTQISKGLLHCWRHSVSHNAISALAVLAGLFDCVDAGTGHKNSGSGSTCIDYDDGETIYKIWAYAKNEGYISQSDPFPTVAMRWFAIVNSFCNEADIVDGWKIPTDAYIKVLKANGLYDEKQVKEQTTDKSIEGNTTKDTNEKGIGKLEADDIIDIAGMCSLKGAIIPKRLGDNMLHHNEYMTVRDNGELYIYRDGVYHLDVKAGDTKAIANKMLEHKTSVKNVNEGVSYVVHKSRIDRDDINCVPFIINMKNGMYDVLNDKLLLHDQKYKSTIQISTTYNPAAKCPAITKFLFELMDPLDVPLVIQFIGYCLIQDVAQQKALLIDGSARNGKSTLIKLITSMVGDSHVSGESLQEISKDRFSTMQLSGKLVNTHPDLSADDIIDTSIFKAVVTETRLTGQGKGKDKIMFDNICTHIFACNKLPNVDEDETAYFRRFIQVTFPNTFDGGDDDKDILNKITTESEKSGFFNLCMIGLRALLEYGEYCYLETTESNEKRYLDKSNPLARFFNERTAPSVNDTPKDVMYWGYVEWCAENGLKHLHSNPFWTQVHKQGLTNIGRESTGKPRRYICEGVSLVIPGKSVQPSGGDKNAWTDKKHIQYPSILSSCLSVLGNIDYIDITDVYRRIYTYKKSEFKTHGRADEGVKTSSEDTLNLCPSDQPSDRISENALFFSQRDVVNSIRDSIINLQVNGKTPIKSVIDHVLESGVTFDKYKTAIEHMKTEGVIYVPKEGFYKCV